MRQMISEILETASMMPEEDQVNYLRTHNCKPLQDVLAVLYRKDLKFKLPKGNVPYQPSPTGEGQGMLYSMTRKFYLFIDGPSGHPGLQKNNMQSKMKREQIFIGMLEAMDPKDAQMLIKIKDQEVPFPGLSLEAVKSAFPGLIPEDEKVEQEVEG